MGKKSGPAAPAAPDPIATANAQAGVNKDAAITQANLNRIDQVTPQGNLSYSIKGYNADGTPQYTQTQTYSPDQQRLYDQNNQVAAALNDTALSNIGRVQDAQATPFTYDGMTPLQTSVGGGNPFDLKGSIPGAGGATGVDPNAAGRGVQSGLDYSGLTKLPGTDDFGAEGQKMADSVYAQAASRLDPRYQQMQDDQRSRLAAQGITENSDAYRRETDNLARDRTDAYNQATYSAQQAGANEQSRLFGLAMGARQQGQNETNAQGQFVNDAQGQTYDQGLSANQNNNQVQQQNFGQNSSNTAFNNAAEGQYYNQDAANATFNNQSRQQQITEAAYLRNQPLDDIAALLNGNQPSSPNFQNFAQVGVAAPDYQGIVQSNYQAALQAQQQQQAARSGALGQIFGTLGTGAMMLSDMRFKENIKRVGKLANGLATYAFNYIGNKAQQFGVMAQEVMGVIPDAVHTDDDGVMYVDYGRVYNAQ